MLPLILEVDDESSVAQLDRVVDLSELIARDSFEQENAIALDDAHRSLFHLYSRRVWNAPTAPRPARIESALGSVRANLEFEFRDSLTRKRADQLSDPPSEPTDLAEWFSELATGAHPHENPRWSDYVRNEISFDRIKQIVSHRSLFFLREPDPWIYAIPTLKGVAKAGLIDLLLDEYGWGKLDHMHSTIYSRLMESLDLDSRIDHYESSTPWQFLAVQNHQWMLALTPGLALQLLGTIYLTEAESPAAMANYLAAWERLGITDPEILHFYELHATADENHRDVALHEVLMPSCGGDRRAAHEIACGIFDGKSLEASYADALLGEFADGRLGNRVSASIIQG